MPQITTRFTFFFFFLTYYKFLLWFKKKAAWLVRVQGLCADSKCTYTKKLTMVHKCTKTSFFLFCFLRHWQKYFTAKVGQLKSARPSQNTEFAVIHACTPISFLFIQNIFECYLVYSAFHSVWQSRCNQLFHLDLYFSDMNDNLKNITYRNTDWRDVFEKLTWNVFTLCLITCI